MPLSPGSHFLVVVTLLDQLDLEEYDWNWLSVILQVPLPLIPPALDPPDGTKLNIEFTRILSKFLMDRDRAGSLWINSQNYADLASCILEFLGDK